MARFNVKKVSSLPGRPEEQWQQNGYNTVNLSSPEAEALRITKFEKTQWETAFAYITENVMFNMRQVIRQCRKNYWGVFDQPIDPTTGREQIWEHLTKTFVDYVVTAYDLDTKDINFRAKHPDAIPLTSVVRSIVKNKLDEIGFGEILDKTLRQLAIDGTVVWVTQTNDEGIGFGDGSDDLNIRLVDLLNFYIDPTVDSIAEADSVIERIVIPISTFKKLAKKEGWKNADLQGKKQVSRNDSLNNPGYNTQADIQFVEIYRRRGLAKEYILTGNMKDTDYVPMEIICSGTNGNWFFHKAKPRKSNRQKGYEEAWLTRVHGRWYGEGVAERLLQKQLHFNIISNIRINRSYISQLGIFLVRKGSGITPTMLSRLAANGALSVSNVETDIKQLPMAESAKGAVEEESLLYQWAQRYTGAQDVTIGEQLPASTPATNASIQNQNASQRFTLIKEGIGMFLQRWMKHQLLPAVMKGVTQGDLIRMHLDPQDVQEIDEKYIVNPDIFKQVKGINDKGGFVDPMQVDQAKNAALERLSSFPERFVKLLHSIDISQYDVETYITNEEFNKDVTVQNINQTMQNLIPLAQFAPEVVTTIINLVRQELDLMGLDSGLLKINTNQIQQQMQQAQMQQQQGGGPNGQSAVNGAAPTTQPGGNSTNLPQASGIGPTSKAMTLAPK